MRWPERLSALSTGPVLPLGVHLYWSPLAASRLEAHLSGLRFDLAVCFQLRTAYYARHVPALRHIIEMTDSLARYRAGADGRDTFTLDSWRRAWLWAGVENLERTLPESVKEVWVCSQEDRRYLQEVIGTRGRVRFVPQGCFPPYRDDPDGLAAARSGRPPRLLFLGNLAYPPNREAVRYLAAEVQPALARLWPSGPVPEIWIVGAGWEKGPRTLPGMRFLGLLADLSGLCSEVDVSLNPVRFGSGAKSKVPESWRLGLPVVSTSFGAEGFVAGPALVIADDAAGIAQAVHGLLSDPMAYRAAVASALECCRRNTWEKIIRQAVDDLVPQ